jgi:hypothetical protein
MSEVTQEKKNNNDEIDLLDLFRRMGKTISGWAKAVWRAFLISVVFLLRRWMPLGISLILGIGISFLLKKTSESFFTSDLVLRTNPVSTSDMISYINRLQKYCRENNKIALADALSLTKEQAENVHDIGAYWIIDKFKDGTPDFVDYSYNRNTSDTVYSRMQDRFDIRVRVNSSQDLTIIKIGIIKFINADSLFQLHNRVRIRQHQELITRLDYDILLLDSLQKVKIKEEAKNRQLQTGAQIIFMQDQKTQLVYADIYNLYARKQALEGERELYKDIVTVLSDFPITIKRVNGVFFYGKHIIPTVFLFTFLFLIYFANRKKLKEVYNKY